MERLHLPRFIKLGKQSAMVVDVVAENGLRRAANDE
jgi:hypothetical protein